MAKVVMGHFGTCTVYMDGVSPPSGETFIEVSDRDVEGCSLYHDGEDLIFYNNAPDLTTLKSARITQTKTALETHLAEHPIVWTDGKHYSVTAEKQSLLNNALAVYQIGVQTGLTPELTWNATGEACTDWTFEGLCALALAIAGYVKPLVAHQQALEVAIRNAETDEEVESIAIGYENIS